MPLAGRDIVAGLLFGGMCTQALAQAVFTCVDAKGRRLTADRPIAECADREQRELSPSGMVKRRLAPTLTTQERVAEEEKNRRALEERNRQAEEKRRERALLMRYPDLSIHQKERLEALQAVDDTIVLARKSVDALHTDRKKMDIELEFYKGDLTRAPAALRRQIEESEQHILAQQRFIANQDQEKLRINERFDVELVKLRQLWAQRVVLPSTTAARGASAPAKR